MSTVFEHQPMRDDFADQFDSAMYDTDVDATAFDVVASESDGDRARRLMDNKERFKESPAQRSAAVTLASLEQAAAVDRQTVVLERQVAALEVQNELTASLLDAQKVANQLTFYRMGPADFRLQRAEEPVQVEGEEPRESVFTQMKRLIGIMPAKEQVATPEELPNDFE